MLGPSCTYYLILAYVFVKHDHTADVELTVAVVVDTLPSLPSRRSPHIYHDARITCAPPARLTHPA